ncbi:MAG: SLBB domain-containing protein [Chthonomonadales bacterium]|nr:SLBB domain-containing protein [Chthonomonadales bacterium]
MRRLMAAWALLLVASLPVLAQETPEADPEYILGPDDVIEIAVPSHSGLERTVNIMPDGRITFPRVGEVIASGKTAHQLATELKTELEKTLNNVTVLVLVREMRANRVSIIGGVRSGGVFFMRGAWKLMDLLAAAGGLGGRPSAFTARLIRGKTEVINLDLASALADPKSPANISLQRNDMVLVDPIERSELLINVLGQVGRPGTIEIQENMSLLDIISTAGNPTDRAGLSRAYVLRNGKEIPLNLRPLLIEGKHDAYIEGFKIQAGDILYIPEIEEQYAVMGMVAKPGYFPIPEKKKVTVLEALGRAGGQGQNADLRQAGIIRSRSGKTEMIKLDLNALLKKSNMVYNLTMEPEDILFIPERGKRGITMGEAFQSIYMWRYIGLPFLW